MGKRRKVPSYRKHKRSGQAVVTLCGKDFYLGLHGTQVSRDEYDRVVAEWLANGRRLADTEETPSLNVEVQLLTGMRPGELVSMRGQDIDQSEQRLVQRRWRAMPWNSRERT